MSFLPGLTNLIHKAGHAVSGLTSKINSEITSHIPGVKTALDLLEGRIVAAAKSGIHDAKTVAPLAGAIAGGKILQSLGSAGGALDTIYGGLTKALDNATQLAQQVEQSHTLTILKHLDQTYSTFKDLSSQLHRDVKQGITSELRIPQQIADALGSTEATWHRSIQELGATNARIAEEVFKPGLHQAGAEPLDTLRGNLKIPKPNATDEAVFSANDRLADLSPGENLDRIYNEFYAWVAQWSNNQESLTEEILQGKAGLGHMFEAMIGSVIHVFWYGAQALEVLGVKLESMYELYRQDILKDNPYKLLSPGEALEATRRDLIPKDQYVEELAKQGIDPTRAQVLYDMAQFLFSPRDAVELYRRGLVDAGQYTELMSQNNLNTEQAQSLYDLMRPLLGAGDLTDLYWRSQITETGYLEFMSFLGYDQDTSRRLLLLSQRVTSPRAVVASEGRRAAANNGWLSSTLLEYAPQDVQDAFTADRVNQDQTALEWLMHWRIPDAEWWVQAYFRGDRQLSEVYEAMRANNYPPEIWDDIIDVSRELLPTWMVPDIVASGVWEQDQAVTHLKKLGFSEQSALILYQYGKSKGKSSKATTASELHGLSLGVSRQLYDDGVISADQYKQVLVEHGYGEEAARLTVDLADLKAQANARKQYAGQLVDQVKLGALSYSDAMSRLYTEGYSDAEVARYALEIQRAQQANYKLPTRSELDKMLKDGIIDAQTWSEVMGVMGYSQFWQQKLLTLLEQG